MEANEFSRLLKTVGELTRSQRQRLTTVLNGAAAGDEAVDLANAKDDSPPCPRCFSAEVYRWGRKAELQRYRCRSCDRTFTPLTGTPLAHMKRRQSWLRYAEAMLQGLSLRDAAEFAGVSTATAYRWRHRMLLEVATVKDTELSGIVEADETFFLESFKGSKAWAKAARGEPVTPPRARPPRKRGGAAAKRGLSLEQVPVLVLRDRTGKHFDAVLRVADKATLGVMLPQLLAPDAVLCTDGAGVYKAVAKDVGLAHEPLNHRSGTRVKQRVFHIQNVNAYDSRLKGWMARFRGVSTKNLGSYLGWYRLLDRERKALSPKGVLKRAMA